MKIGVKRSTVILGMLLVLIKAEQEEAFGDEKKSNKFFALASRIHAAIGNNKGRDMVDLSFDPDNPGDVILWREFMRFAGLLAEQSKEMLDLSKAANNCFP
jgi:hypothetical protein